MALQRRDKRGRACFIGFYRHRQTRAANRFRRHRSYRRESHARIPFGQHVGPDQLLKFMESRRAEKCDRIGRSLS